MTKSIIQYSAQNCSFDTRPFNKLNLISYQNASFLALVMKYSIEKKITNEQVGNCLTHSALYPNNAVARIPQLI